MTKPLLNKIVDLSLVVPEAHFKLDLHWLEFPTLGSDSAVVVLCWRPVYEGIENTLYELEDAFRDLA